MARSHSHACRASSAACLVSSPMTTGSSACRTMRPSSSAPSSSLWRYQLSRHASARGSRTGFAPFREADRPAREAPDLLVDGDDCREVVGLGYWNAGDHLQADVPEALGGLLDDVGLRGVALDPERQQ